MATVSKTVSKKKNTLVKVLTVVINILKSSLTISAIHPCKYFPECNQPTQMLTGLDLPKLILLPKHTSGFKSVPRAFSDI